MAFVTTVTINWLSGSVASAGAGTLDPAALRHEIKLTYCVEQRSKRFYRTENLEDLCTLKVAFFDDLVSIMNKVIIDFLKVQLVAFHLVVVGVVVPSLEEGNPKNCTKCFKD